VGGVKEGVFEADVTLFMVSLLAVPRAEIEPMMAGTGDR
jgi:hypothetical protein